MPPAASNRIYLDHAATTPVDPLVLEAMLPYLQGQFGNPSSLHYWGREARKAMETARQSIANNLGCKPEELYFTSGATEADNLTIFGVTDTLKQQGRHLITTSMEHAAVANACEKLEAQGWSVTWLPVDEEGFVAPETLTAAIRPDTVLTSIIHGNNEIGTIQDIQTLGEILKAKKVPFHVDAVQTIGKLPFNLTELPIDYLSLSGHKIYGPKGIGALYVRNDAALPTPLIVGGGQENNIRSGTENLAGIVGLAKALELATQQMEQETTRLRQLQTQLIEMIQTLAPDAILNGPGDVSKRVPGNVHFSFPPGEGEALVLHFDLKSIAVSSGSACHSEVIEPSRIVKALGKSDAIAKATVRFSLGKSNTDTDIQRIAEILPGILKRLSRSRQG